jgi:hypothetical protein
MLVAVVMALMMFVGQGAADVALPDTPQGKQVAAWLKGFNSGDAKAFEKAQQDTMAPGVLAKRTPEERAQMFQRLKGDFGTMKVTKIVKATAQQIQIIVPAQEAVGTFTFDFEDKAPFRITGLGIDVEGGGA